MSDEKTVSISEARASIEAYRSDPWRMSDPFVIAESYARLGPLVDVAEAVLAYEQARVAFEESLAKDDRPVFEGHRWTMSARHRELLAALAKVRQ